MKSSTLFVLILATLVLLLAAGCGGGGSSVAVTQPGASGVPVLSHVIIVVGENHGYSSVVGNPSMPYFNGLVSQGGLATQYFANTHPSLPNYFVLTTGENIALDDSFTGTVTDDNVVRQLLSAGKTWKMYAESLPSPAYLGGSTGNYSQDHNPFSFFSDIVNDPAQAANIVPFSQFSADLAGGELPNYSFVVPNQVDNAHNCPAGLDICDDSQKLAAFDGWLQTNIQPLLDSSSFKASGLLVVLFDEADDLDISHGGGRIPMLIMSPKAKVNYKSTTVYQHQSTLRLSLEALGVHAIPGGGETAPDMAEFFQ